MTGNLQDQILSVWLGIVKGEKPSIYFFDIVLDELPNKDRLTSCRILINDKYDIVITEKDNIKDRIERFLYLNHIYYERAVEKC